jgi:hypothetical protein
MTLQNFRLSPKQDDSDFVTVLVDVDSVRVIGRITREAIVDFAGGTPDADQRIDIVRQNIAFFERLIADKYEDDFTRHDRGSDRNVVMRVEAEDLPTRP